jgi:hypothetical protein
MIALLFVDRRFVGWFWRLRRQNHLKTEVWGAAPGRYIGRASTPAHSREEGAERRTPISGASGVAAR